MKKNTIKYIFAGAFLILSSLPFWGIWVQHLNDKSRNWRLIEFSGITGVGTFNRFIADQHGFRYELSNTIMNFYAKALKENPIPNSTVLGKDGWMFLGDFYNQTNTNSLGVKDVDQHDIDSVCYNLNKIQSFCDSIGVRLYLVITPDKQTIYPEYMSLKPTSKPKLRSVIVAGLKKNDNKTSVIDLTDLLLKDKKQGNILYYKTDSHWNSYGAFLGTQEVVRIISQDIPLKSIESTDFIIRHDKAHKKETDLANMFHVITDEETFYIKSKDSAQIDIKTLTAEDGSFHYSIKNGASENSIKALVIRDSFFGAMMDIFATALYRTDAIHPNYIFDRKRILKEIEQNGKPDFIMFQVVERNLDQIKYE